MARWDELFDDLEGRWQEESRAEALGEVPDRVRRDRATVRLADRLLATEGRSIRLGLRGGVVVEGVLDDVGEGWCSVVDQGRASVVRLAAVVSVEGLGRAARPDESAMRRRVGAPLRALARDRRPVRVVDLDGTVREGVLESIGADHVDLTLTPVDLVGRRGGAARRAVLVTDALVVVSQV